MWILFGLFSVVTLERKDDGKFEEMVGMQKMRKERVSRERTDALAELVVQNP